MATKKTTKTNNSKLASITSLITASLLSGASFAGLLDPHIAQLLTAGAVGVAAFNESLRLKPGNQA